MSLAALVLLVPEVVLLPPDAPPGLAPVAESCARAIAASPGLRVTRLSAADPSAGAPATARAELDEAARHYRELRLREARQGAEQVVAVVAARATTADDFALLLEARLRLAMTMLAQRRAREARAVLDAAVRQAPDARVTEADWPPALVAAFDQARAAAPARHPLAIDARTTVAAIAPRLWIDGARAADRRVELGGGEHVVVAAAPGHVVERRVVQVPSAEPVAIQLPASTAIPSAIVIEASLAPAPGGVRVTLRAAGREPASRASDVAGAPAVARSLAEMLAGAVRTEVAVAPASTPDGAAPERAVPGRRRRPTERSGSVLGRWWFWTIVGTAATIGVVGALAASRSDPGTDVHVGMQ